MTRSFVSPASPASLICFCALCRESLVWFWRVVGPPSLAWFWRSSILVAHASLNWPGSSAWLGRLARFGSHVGFAIFPRSRSLSWLASVIVSSFTLTTWWVFWLYPDTRPSLSRTKITRIRDVERDLRV
jgi:hypothetical protein